MAITHYPAIIERGPEGYGVFFPDLPGCVSAGTSASETALNAEEALALHILGMIEDGESLPAPSDINQIQSDPDVSEVARILVRAETPGRKIRVNVMLDEGLVSAIDTVSKNRSGFLSDAARMALAAVRAG